MDNAGLRPGCCHRPRSAGGANLVCFTTGRGSVFGLQAVALDQARHQHADVHPHGRTTWTSTAATILDGEESLQECGERIFGHHDAGRPAASAPRARGSTPGGAEFAPWVIVRHDVTPVRPIRAERCRCVRCPGPPGVFDGLTPIRHRRRRGLPATTSVRIWMAAGAAWSAAPMPLWPGVLWADKEGGLYIGRLVVDPALQRQGVANRAAGFGRGGSPAAALAASLAFDPDSHSPTIARLFGRRGFVEAKQHAHPGYAQPTFVDMVKQVGTVDELTCAHGV